MAVAGKISKKKDNKDKHGVGPQAKTVAEAMIRHWLTIFDVPTVICSDRGSQFVGSWFKRICKHMGIRHAKTVAYHNPSNGRAEVAGRQMFENFCQLHIEVPRGNWFHSLSLSYKPSMTYRGLRDRRPTAFFSYGIEYLGLYCG